MPTNLDSTQKKTNYVVGSRPKHTHKGPVSGQWECNSPYCYDLDTDKPEHGGPKVTVQGQEDWRR